MRYNIRTQTIVLAVLALLVQATNLHYHPSCTTLRQSHWVCPLIVSQSMAELLEFGIAGDEASIEFAVNQGIGPLLIKQLLRARSVPAR